MRFLVLKITLKETVMGYVDYFFCPFLRHSSLKFYTVA